MAASNRSGASAELAALEQQVLFGARVLAEQVGDIWGHVTCRLPDADPRRGFLLKHLRIPPPPIDPDEVMVYDYDGRKLVGTQGDPWEVPLYTAVFRARPEVSAVVHFHPPVATALSTAGQTIHAVTHEGWEFGDGIPAFSGEVIDTNELGAKMAAVLQRHHACMLEGHGAVVVGRDVPDVIVKAIYLERTAKQIVWASSVGKPKVLPRHIGKHLDELRGPKHHPQLWDYLRWTHAREKASKA
jgi:ribulose-5-phosphate 4-epimerase/fuculose-1-phosphate aldolase